MIRNNAILRRVAGQSAAFRRGEIDLPSLQHEFAAAMGALEGDVPKSVRDAVLRGEA